MKAGSFVGKNEGTSRREYLAWLVDLLDDAKFTSIAPCQSCSLRLSLVWCGQAIPLRLNDRVDVKVAVLAAVERDSSDIGRLWRQLRRVLVTIQSSKLVPTVYDAKADAVNGELGVLESCDGRIVWSVVASESCEVVGQLLLLSLTPLLEPRKTCLLDSFGTICALLLKNSRVDELHMAIGLDNPGWILRY